MDTTFVVFCIVLFVAVLFFIEFGYYWYDNHFGKHAKSIRKRLDQLTDPVVKATNNVSGIIKFKHQDETRLFSLLADHPFFIKASDLLYQSGLTWSLLFFLQISLASALVVSILLGLLGIPLLFSPISFVAGICLPWFFVDFKKQRRFNRIEMQLPEAIDTMARSIRAGQTIQSAILLVANELPEPISREFTILVEETKLGTPFNEALQSFARRLPITDVQYLVIAILIQRETGGNLHEILTSISKIIRERFQFQSEIKVLSAEGRSSAKILCTLPVIMFFVMQAINPEQMGQFMHSEYGQHGIMYGLGMMLVGIFTMSRIVKIKL